MFLHANLTNCAVFAENVVELFARDFVREISMGKCRKRLFCARERSGLPDVDDSIHFGGKANLKEPHH